MDIAEAALRTLYVALALPSMGFAVIAFGFSSIALGSLYWLFSV